uniref:Rho GDP-dissociation inhibitor 1-like n=1 Tax=Rhizophora mucronata TaxID=61149 RepID=A0A2P2IR09_RHIMU
MEPRVKFHSIGIISDDFGEINTPLPGDESQSAGLLFSLREGSRYHLKLTFSVLHNIVSGLTYSNTVWKGGLQVDQSRGMLGTFAPQQQPYVHALEEETTPSGLLARGIYSAILKFEDDDRRCHMELKYSFEIKKSS